MDMGSTKPHPDSLYYQVILDALERARKASADLDLAKASASIAPARQGLPLVDELTFALKIAVVTAMTFSPMCLEAYINECYASSLPELFDEVERFSHELKWMMLPKLLGGKETFNKAAAPYQTFAELISTRNKRLMHFKLPQEILGGGSSKTRKPYFGDLVGNMSLAEKYFTSVGEMIHELRKLTNGKTVIPQFLNGTKYMSTVTSTASMSFESLPLR